MIIILLERAFMAVQFIYKAWNAAIIVWYGASLWSTVCIIILWKCLTMFSLSSARGGHIQIGTYIHVCWLASNEWRQCPCYSLDQCNGPQALTAFHCIKQWKARGVWMRHPQNISHAWYQWDHLLYCFWWQWGLLLHMDRQRFQVRHQFRGDVLNLCIYTPKYVF